MGSLVLAQPMFARLSARYPGATLHVLVFRRNREVLDLLDVVPRDHVLTIDDRSAWSLLTGCLRVVARMRALAPDVVIDCELFARVSSILSFCSGAPLHVGFHPHTQEGLYRGSFISRPVLYNPYRHLTHQLLSMVDAIASSGMPTVKQEPEAPVAPPPMVTLSADERQRMSVRLLTDHPGSAGKTLVLIYPSGGLLPIRAWPIAHYIELCRALLADGYAVGVIGLAQDRPVAAAIRAACPDAACIDLTGYTASVRELLTLFHLAGLLITNDGGPGQFAALTPVPSIVFFGPETPGLYGSWAPNATNLFLGLSCSPCLTAFNHRNSPCDGDNQCLIRITPARVLSLAKQALVTRPVS